MLPHKGPTSRPPQLTISPNFIETEKDKQNEKAEKFVLIEEQEKKPLEKQLMKEK